MTIFQPPVFTHNAPAGRKRRWRLLILLTWIAPLVLAPGCGWQKEHRFAGRTMGTEYHITVIGGAFQHWTQLEKNVATRLVEINQAMSTYIESSEISRLNAADPRGTCTPIPVSAEMMAVLQAANRIYRWSEGAWDATVGPLVSLWGFGKNPGLREIPSQDEVRQLLPRVGFGYIRILGPDRICKARPGLTLDLASIAKGYAVDRVAGLIKDAGFDDFLVEIGGEVYAAGKRIDGSPWRVGISWPDKNHPPDELYQALEITGMALATSGDYRNFFEVDGVIFSHVLDPRTGYPVRNGVVSTSVMAGNCTIADGLATALMVMGAEAGISLVNRLPQTECLIIVRKEADRLTAFRSSGFP
jgi:thiamine biosynthesis lipoprotein